MEEITIKLTGEQVEKILIEYLKKKHYTFDKFKVTHIQIDDKREMEYDNNYGIKYIEFDATTTKPLTDQRV